MEISSLSFGKIRVLFSFGAWVMTAGGTVDRLCGTA